jgi:hypothetical protein
MWNESEDHLVRLSPHPEMNKTRDGREENEYRAKYVGRIDREEEFRPVHHVDHADKGRVQE